MDRNHRAGVALAALMLSLTGCSEIRDSQPARTAREQLLISTAVDRAVEKLDLGLPRSTPVFVNSEYFHGYDRNYAVSAIRARLLETGARLLDDRDKAEVIVELRSGAMSINQQSTFVGLPSLPFPLPLTGIYETPELALIRHREQYGVAKIAVTAYEAETGQLRENSGPLFGLAWEDRWSVAGIGWRHDETLPRRPVRDHLPDVGGQRSTGRLQAGPRPSRDGSAAESDLPRN